MRLWLKKIRGEKSQKEMSAILGIAQGFYSDIESGKKTPSPLSAQKIAKILNIDWMRFFETADDLLRDEDPETA